MRLVQLSRQSIAFPSPEGALREPNGLLALGGDLGCSSGPTFAGMMASAFGDNLKKGILCAIFFPALLTVLTIFTKRRKAKI